MLPVHASGYRLRDTLFYPFITRYKCGVSFVPSDSASFARAVAQVFADNEAFCDGLEQVRRDYSWKVIAGQYIQIYNGNDSGPD